MHLRDADPFGDLRLGHRLEEPEHQHGSFALGQAFQQRSQRLPILDPVDAGVDVAQRVGDGADVVIVAASPPLSIDNVL